jgi:hypothetical protein
MQSYLLPLLRYFSVTFLVDGRTDVTPNAASRCDFNISLMNATAAIPQFPPWFCLTRFCKYVTGSADFRKKLPSNSMKL